MKEAFIIYNSQGNSKGMAVVSFQRPNDAAVARAKYNGKYIDQSASIPGWQDLAGILLICTYICRTANKNWDYHRWGSRGKSESATYGTFTSHSVRRYLCNCRTPTSASQSWRSNVSFWWQERIIHTLHLSLCYRQPRQHSAPSIPSAPRRQQIRRKKGPRRIKKSVVQLDKEMEEYRASANVFDLRVRDSWFVGALRVHVSKTLRILCCQSQLLLLELSAESKKSTGTILTGIL